MKVVKAQVILFMQEKIILTNQLDPVEVKELFELDNKTFYRYIQEIRAYHSNMYINGRLLYSKKHKKYFFYDEKI